MSSSFVNIDGSMSSTVGTISVEDAFCDPANIVTAPGIERMIAALCELPCADEKRVADRTILNEKSRKYSLDGRFAAAVSPTTSLQDFIAFAESARQQPLGVTSEQEEQLNDVLFKDLDENVESNSVMIPFATGGEHWVMVQLQGQKQQDGSFSYKASEVNTDGISRPISDRLFNIIEGVVKGGGASLSNQLEPEVKIFDYHLQFGQNCSTAVAMMTSASLDAALEGRVPNLDKFISGDDVEMINEGRDAVAAYMFHNDNVGDAPDLEKYPTKVEAMTKISECDIGLRKIAFDKISENIHDEDFWRDTILEHSAVSAGFSLDLSSLEVRSVSGVSNSELSILIEDLDQSLEAELSKLVKVSEGVRFTGANHDLQLSHELAKHGVDGVDPITFQKIIEESVNAQQESKLVASDAEIAAQLQNEESRDRQVKVQSQLGDISPAGIQNSKQGEVFKDEVVISSEESKARQIESDRKMAEKLASQEGVSQQEIYDSIIAEKSKDNLVPRIPSTDVHGASATQLKTPELSRAQ